MLFILWPSSAPEGVQTGVPCSTAINWQDPAPARPSWPAAQRFKAQRRRSHNYMVQALAANRTNHALDVWVLPRRSWCRNDLR